MNCYQTDMIYIILLLTDIGGGLPNNPLRNACTTSAPSSKVICRFDFPIIIVIVSFDIIISWLEI